MNTKSIWVTREPKGYDENVYKIHIDTQPTLEAHELHLKNELIYWESDRSIKIEPLYWCELNPGECMEWVMVKKEGF